MNTAIQYRRGYPAEVDSFKHLGILSYESFKAILSVADWQTMDHFLNDDKMWQKLVSMATIFVAENWQGLTGMAFLVSSGNPTAIYPADWCYIRMVGVDPAYRGQGIAKTLTRMCINRAIETGEHTIGLHTSALTRDSQHIYEKAGFRKYKEIAPIYGMPYWLYKLEIAPK